jgi:hypothetical protein
VTSISGGINAIGKRFYQLALPKNSLDSVFIVQDNQNPAGDGQQTLRRFLDRIVASDGHVFVVKREVPHGLAHGTPQALGSL